VTTVTADDIEAIASDLDADQLAHLGAVFTARARERRVLLTEDEARAAIDHAPPTRHGVPFVGEVRGATRILVERGWHPEQIVDSMTVVAEQMSVHPLVAVEAVACGIADGMAIREGVEHG
jgi:hypothetical protein